jgi:hypothetical protein
MQLWRFGRPWKVKARRLGIALEISVRQNPMLWLLVHDQGDIAAAQRK